MSEAILINGKAFQGDMIPLKNSCILVIQGEKGLLGCGYLALETAEKLGHALAIVTGVKSFADMQEAVVVKVSSAAQKLGILPGMKGKDALLKLA